MSNNSPRRACLIGLGLITEHYLTGLSKSEFLHICAVSDLNENAAGRKHYSTLPFYSDYKVMLSEQAPDYVIISTPPQTHYKIASYCLSNNINIIIEKPVTLCMEDFNALQVLAKNNNLVFRTLFHWHGGIETRAFTQDYNASQIKEIKVNVFDPYCTDGIIKPDRRPLMGAWIDSGVNILSMIRLWLPFDSLEVISVCSDRCKETGLPVFVNAKLIIDKIPVEITIDWCKGINQKESYITLGEKTLYINHSAQTIQTHQGSVDYSRMPRLDEHYNCLFTNMDQSSNADFSHSVHKALFEVDNKL